MKNVKDYQKFEYEIEIVKTWARQNKNVDVKPIIKIFNKLFSYISQLEMDNFEMATKIINIQEYTKIKSNHLKKLLNDMAEDYRKIKNNKND